MQGRNRPWIKAWALACGLVLQALVLVPQHAGAQNRDPNAPFRDAYDVQYGRRLVGSWSGTISGSSVSQADGQMEGQAVFMRRGYEGRDDFGLILHDHRHRDDQTFSEIGINSIPCGPSPGVTRAIHPIEVQNAGGGYATALFINRLARAPAGFQAFPAYGPELDSPATVETEWTEDTFTLRLSGPMISGVLPVRENGTFDYERQREGELDEIHLSAEFTLERTPETADLFDRTLCEQKDFIQVVETLPESGRENVVLEGANFYIEFDTDIERTTLDETTVFMTTRNPGGGPIFVATELSLVSPDRVEVSPTEPLLWGTVYDIEVVSGENGLRGRDEEMLERDFSFSISTLVDPEDIRLEIHQVSRDAPLVHGKPAAGRIFVEWEERDDVHPAWQVLNYPVVAEIRDNRDEPVFPELSARVRRPDLLSDEDRRLGEHSLNLFDWTPTPGVLNSLASWFVAAECRVMTASDGMAGLSSFAQIRPDLVVTDIIMPDHEGVEAIMAMKARDATVPILAISGGGRIGPGDFLSLALKLGADAALPKPFRSHELLAVSANLLSTAAKAA